MTEIEVKILDINRRVVEEKLIALGATKTFDDSIHAIYYDIGEGTLRKMGKTLRLRKEGSNTVLTIKIDVVNASAKERKEQEVRVFDFEAMCLILEGLGFTPWLEMKKNRTSYALQGAHFEFDKYHEKYGYIPEFLEIEGNSLETIFHYAEVLGFSRQDCRPWDAVELAAHYDGKP